MLQLDYPLPGRLFPCCREQRWRQQQDSWERRLECGGKRSASFLRLSKIVRRKEVFNYVSPCSDSQSCRFRPFQTLSRAVSGRFARHFRRFSCRAVSGRFARRFRRFSCRGVSGRFRRTFSPILIDHLHPRFSEQTEVIVWRRVGNRVATSHLFTER